MTTPPARAGAMGERLRTIRERRGLTAIDAQILLRRILPQSQWVNASTITRLETGDTKRKVDLTLIAALCDAYEVRLDDEFPELVEDTTIVVDLFDRHRPRAVARDRRRASARTNAKSPEQRGLRDGHSACKVAPLKVVTSLFALEVHPSGDSDGAMEAAA